MTRPSWHAAGVEGRAYGVGSSHARAFQRPSIHRATRDTRDERPTRCISDWPMTFTDAQLIGWLQQFIWPLARVSSALLIVPVLGSGRVSARIRMTLALLVTLLIVPTLPQPPLAELISSVWWSKIGRAHV